MQQIDYYKVLGVSRKANAETIKKAYRRLARKYHPDVSKEADAEIQFKRIVEAYDVLKNKEKRAAYDRGGSAWRSGSQAGAADSGKNTSGWSAYSTKAGGFGSKGFGDFFDSIFTGSFSSKGGGGFHSGVNSYASKGADQYANVHISLLQAFQGEEISVRLAGDKSLKIKLPKGVSDGQKMRLVGQGAKGAGGGPNGDLYLQVLINPHPHYKLFDKDIELDFPIAPWEAALGAAVTVPTPGGRVKFRVPPGSYSGKRMRLKGRGMPQKQPGDFFVRLVIVAPPAKDKNQRNLYKLMREKFAFDPRRELAGL